MANWDAIRVGRKYCSSACGGGCTFVAYQSAKRKAARLAKRLHKEVGGVWDVKVHENLGWWYRVQNKITHIEVTENLGRYNAWLQISGPWGGNLVMDGPTPRHAVSKLKSEAKRQLDSLMPIYKLLRMS